MMLNIYYGLIFHLYSFFGEMSVHAFWIIDLRAFLWCKNLVLYIYFSALLLLCPSYMLYFHFHSVLCIFRFPLRFPLWSMDYLVVCCSFSKYLEIFLFSLLLIFSFIPLGLGNLLCIISILLHLLTSVLWARTWSILVTVPWILEKKVYSAVVR